MKTKFKIFFVIATVAVIVLFFIQNKSSIRLDNAYVSGRVLQIKATGEGILQENKLERGIFVEKGTVLYLIDTTFWQIEIERLTEELRSVIKNEKMFCLESVIEENQLEAELIDLRVNTRRLDRATTLSQINAYSEENMDELSASVSRSQIAIRAAEQRIEIARFANQYTLTDRPEVKLILAQLKQAFYKRSIFQILAPYDGFIYEIYAYPGQMVNEGDRLLTFIPNEKMLIEANALESEIEELTIGAEVIVKPDVYVSKVRLKGVVESIVPSTASALSGIPRNNTNSNWIKVAQRVPVLISISQDQLENIHLPIGSSVEVELPLSNPIGSAVARESVLRTSNFDNSKSFENDYSGQEEQQWQKNYESLVNNVFLKFSKEDIVSGHCDF